MWWLSFLDRRRRHPGGLITHARMLAALNKLCRVSHFAEGHSISAALIPFNSIGRMLSPM
jgi:hypothetical protein